MQARAHLLQHDLSPKDLNTKKLLIVHGEAESEFILIKMNLGKVSLSAELFNLALYGLYFLNTSCTFVF